MRGEIRERCTFTNKDSSYDDAVIGTFQHFYHVLFAFTDDVGIFQHSKYGVPDRNHGYTTDDNARALILAVMLYEKSKKSKYLKLI